VGGEVIERETANPFTTSYGVCERWNQMCFSDMKNPKMHVVLLYIFAFTSYNLSCEGECFLPPHNYASATGEDVRPCTSWQYAAVRV